MRVTLQHQVGTTTHILQKSQETIDQLRTQVASNQRITAPRDDPQGTQQAINLRSHLAATQGSLNSVSTSQDWLQTTDSALEGLNALIEQASTKALNALNDSVSASDRQNVANEVAGLFQEAVDLGNTDYGGQYVFAGFQVGTRPFDAQMDTLTAVYHGDEGVIKREIAPGSQITINVPGQPLFSGALEALKSLYDGLTGNQPDAIRSAMDALEGRSQDTLAQLARTGGLLNVLDDTQARLQSYHDTVQGLIGKVEGVDVTSAAVNLEADQQAYDASLTVLAQNTFTSLFDYLG